MVRWVNGTFGTGLDAARLRDDVLRSNWVRTCLASGASRVWGLSATVIGTVFLLFPVLLFTFCFAADGPRLRRALCAVLGPSASTPPSPSPRSSRFR